jgi:hypothetical protein
MIWETNPTWTFLDPNPGRSLKELMINSLTYGMSLSRVQNYFIFFAEDKRKIIKVLNLASCDEDVGRSQGKAPRIIDLYTTWR